MKIISTKENLISGLNIVGRLTGRNLQLPILANVLLKTEKGRLKMAATNLEIGITTYLGAEIKEEGGITVPGRVLIDYLSNLSANKIELTKEDNKLQIKSEGGKSTILGIEETEFPLIPEVKEENPLILKSLELKDAILKTVFAAALDETRPVLTAVYFNLEKSGSKPLLKIVATDSFRLAETSVFLEKEVNALQPLLIPAVTLMELARLINEKTGDIMLYFGENQAQFKTSQFSLVTRLLEGSFPDYQTIIPKEFKTNLILEKEKFLGGLKLANLFARDAGGTLKLKVEKDGLVLEVASVALGEHQAKIDAEVKGEELTVAFNARYLLDGLNALASDKIEFQISSPTTPGVLKSSKQTNYLYLVMPLRVD
ncbi:DNA polymerase III subunit beta [Candidatus Berkelbacteria bacterium]|nr:DNA polymerase III subunit beta [Candidatus Berkelbacteria bacterium]